MCGYFKQKAVPVSVSQLYKPVDADKSTKVTVGKMATILSASGQTSEATFGYVKQLPQGTKFIFNVRAEGFENASNNPDYSGPLTIHLNPWVSEAFQQNRVIIPVLSFTEVSELDGVKSAFEIGMKDGGMFALGALVDTDIKRGIPGVSIITTWPFTQLKKEIGKERSPLIIAPDDIATWLDRNTPLSTALATLHKRNTWLFNLKKEPDSSTTQIGLF